MQGVIARRAGITDTLYSGANGTHKRPATAWATNYVAATSMDATPKKTPVLAGSLFRVEAPVTRRSPHRPVLEGFHSYGSSVY